MGPPRRNGARNQPAQYSSDSSAPPQSPVFPRQTTPATSKPATNAAMTPSTRHLHNLKVLRRRDPSILAVFDQFSHVAVYKFLDGKWEKEAYEGTMFLYERNAYPPYGYYILNRVGMDDFIGRLYPEDFLQIVGKLTVVQSFPDFTERRLASVRATAPQQECGNKFSSVWAVPNVESLTKAEKGDAVTIGLWTLDQVAREPLFGVMQRLHSYIRQNLPYPDEFQYGPDRQPLSSPSPAPMPANAQSLNGFPLTQTTANSAQHPHSSMSELDKLFSKLAPSPPPVTSDSAQAAKAKKNGKMTVESLFATMSGTESASDNNPSSASSSISFPSSASPAPSTGIRLLDSIFASAASITTVTQTPDQTRTDHSSTIYTPTPSTNGNPQVLSQDVLTQLMGLPPSRAASTVSYSSSAVSHPSSREGYADNEDDSDSGVGRLSEFEDGVSESSTVLDSGAEDLGAPAPGHGHIVPVNFGQGSTHHSHGTTTNGRIQGDVTPRPPLPGFGGSAEGTRPIPSRSSTASSLPPSLRSMASNSTITNGQRCISEPQAQPKAKAPRAASQQSTPRRLVPFEPDSELWPYSRNEAPTHQHASVEQDSSDDIIELDFNDTSALSDPDAFNKVIRNGRGTSHHQHNGSTSSGGGMPANGNAKGKVKEKPNRRKTKKERAAEQARIRQEIEDSWDSPAPAGGMPNAAHFPTSENDKNVYPEPPPPATPSPCPSPVLGPVVSPRAAITPLSLVGGPRGGTDSRGSPVGQSTLGHPSPMDLRKKIAAINGHTHPHDHAPKDHKETVKDSLLSAVLLKEAHRPTHSTLEKNDFVREVLTLIHTDKAFVDSLYREYTSRV